MARKPRIHYVGAIYHVMLRGNGGDAIFFEDRDREKFLTLLYECVERFSCRIHAFCLMHNHVHLALQVNDIPLSKIIQNISFRFTRAMNKKRKKIGHLFQGRYKAILVDADNYLLTLVKYIHLNPVKAKLVQNPDDYIWSSHRTYLKLSSFEWLTTSYVLDHFPSGNKSPVTLYREFIAELPEKEIYSEAEDQKTFPVICDDYFMKKLEKVHTQQQIKYNITLNQIIQFVCAFYQIDESQLSVKSSNRFNNKIRAVIAWLAIELKVSTITQVAYYFNRHHSNISRIMQKITSFATHNLLNNIKESIQSAHTQA